MTAPSLSLIMAVYNSEAYLRTSIDSLLQQTYTDFECILIDDASQDQSGAILDHYAQLDPRVRVIHLAENQGLTACLNLGLQQARGTFIARQDADDISLPDRFEKQIKAFSNPSVVLVAGAIQMIDAAGQPLEKSHSQASSVGVPQSLLGWRLLFYNIIEAHGLVMMRKDAVLACGAYDEKVRYAQDYELWSRLIQLGDFHILPDTLLQYRLHEDAITQQKQAQQIASVVQTIQKQALALGIKLNAEDAYLVHRFWLGQAAKASPVKLLGLLRAYQKAFRQAYGEKQVADLIQAEIKAQLDLWQAQLKTAPRLAQRLRLLRWLHRL